MAFWVISLFGVVVYGDILKGGTLGDGYDLSTIEIGEHEGFTRVVFGITYWEGDSENAGKKVDDGGYYIFVLDENKTIRADFSGFRSATVKMPTLTSHPILKEIVQLKGEEYGDDSSLFFKISLQKEATIKSAYLTNPARFVLDVYPK